MKNNSKSTKQILFENIHKLESKTIINENYLKESDLFEKKPTEINKRVANRLFKMGKVIYIQDAPAVNGILDTSRNLFMLSKRSYDVAINIYTGGLRPDQLGFDFFIQKLEERSEFPLKFYTLFSDEFLAIDDGEVRNTGEENVKKEEPVKDENPSINETNWNLKDFKGFERFTDQERNYIESVLSLVTSDNDIKSEEGLNLNPSEIYKKYYEKKHRDLYDDIKSYSGRKTNPMQIANAIKMTIKEEPVQENLSLAFDQNVVDELKKIYLGTPAEKTGILDQRIKQLLETHATWLEKVKDIYSAEEIARILFQYDKNLGNV